MSETFADELKVGGKSNSLGRSSEVIEAVLNDASRLGELYTCLFDKDAWMRMRAADSLEKICRQQPDWFEPYIDRIATELTSSSQPSIQWHIAQMYKELHLTGTQKKFAISWLKGLLSRPDIDWIVASNAMDTLAHFTTEGSFSKLELKRYLKIQQRHHSKAVVARANKLLDMITK